MGYAGGWRGGTGKWQEETLCVSLTFLLLNSFASFASKRHEIYVSFSHKVETKTKLSREEKENKREKKNCEYLKKRK